MVAARALVTGASGTVGTEVVQRLVVAGWQVVALARRPVPKADGVEPVTADLLEPAALQGAIGEVQFAVHCAAALSGDPTLCWRTNAEGTHYLVEALIAAGCRRLVHISSLSVYDVRQGWTIDEDSPLWTDGSYPYGRSKVEAERIVAAASTRGLESIILRPVPILSMHATSFWGPLALERARSSDRPVFSSPQMPFVHVANLADVVMTAVRSQVPSGRAYDVVDGHAPTVRYLETIAAAIGRRAPPLSVEAPLLRVDGRRIRSELDYRPADRFEEFLSQML
jgi:nucleoside-diphosphate-sugar epimerase